MFVRLYAIAELTVRKKTYDEWFFAPFLLGGNFFFFRILVKSNNLVYIGSISLLTLANT